MLVVTTNDLPGWEIQQVCGEVFGLTVRSRNAFSQMAAGFKSLVGGELKGMTANLVTSRNEVMGRMIEEARLRGGNAVVAMRFDTSEMSDTWTEICAYGTAVVAVPVTAASQEMARRLGYGAAAPTQPPIDQLPIDQPPPVGPPQG
ncbi:MAG: YbjQ family protein [Nocardioides sp.]